MIFDWDTCCRPAETREIQGEDPATLAGAGLWVGVLSSGRCLLAGAEPGAVAGSGAGGDLLLGYGNFTLRPATPCHLLALRLEGLAVEEFLKGLPRPRFVDSAACPNAAEQLARLCAGMETADSAAQPDPARGAAPYALLCMLAHADEETRRLSPIVAEAVESIRNNYMALYGVEDLAAALGVSKCHLVRMFSAEMGISPGKYLTRTRLEAAKLLLLDREYNLDTIANLCGFSGANYLCRVFKREEGITPLAWRAAAAPHAAPKKLPPRVNEMYV